MSKFISIRPVEVGASWYGVESELFVDEASRTAIFLSAGRLFREEFCERKHFSFDFAAEGVLLYGFKGRLEAVAFEERPIRVTIEQSALRALESGQPKDEFLERISEVVQWI